MKKCIYIPKIEDQNEFKQLVNLLLLKEVNIEECHFFIDDGEMYFNRTQYQLLKLLLREGDELYITSLYSLGHNKKRILDEWNDITKQIQADIISLDIPFLDTRLYRSSIGSFLPSLIADVLPDIAEDVIKKNRSCFNY